MTKNLVAKYIEREKLFTRNDKVLVTLSGGADSVALLRILLSLGYKCEAAHCNFHLRQEESDRDEAFVRELCESFNTHLYVKEFDTYTYAKEKKVSLEMAARELRYQWFEEIRLKWGASVIAVAHHKDDNIETILLNLIRGTGIKGLTGISPVNKNIVRPLLCLTRSQIIDYLNEIGQPFVIDSTNLQDEYTRNKIRLNIIPLMEKINPSVKESIAYTAKHLVETEKVYNKAIEESKKRVITPEGISIDNLINEASPQALLYEILYPLGFNSSQIDDILQSLEGQSGRQFISNCGWRIIKDRKILIIDQLVKNSNTPPFRLEIKELQYTNDFIIPKDKTIACFDAEKISQPFTIRKWEHGDTFLPFGMKGKKRVSDYLTDRKFSIKQKENQWVLCSNEKITWLIGERIDNRFRIDESTRKIILVKII